MPAAQPAVSGLAASIRSAVDSETFDLAGQTPATIEKAIHDAFSTPIPSKEMLRITLITGAGKLERQKYDEGAAKAVTGTLRNLGFVEDRGASAIIECAGSFKLQHDTGKNLKTVVVFPRIDTPSLADGIGEASAAAASSFLPEKSPEHKIAHSSLNIFERMIGSTCPSWSQKKACLQVLDDIRQQLESMEKDKLLQGIPLSDSEQTFYDSVSATSLEEKAASVKELMHKQVEEGRITAQERQLLLNQVKERVVNLTKEIAQAQEGNKLKRVENLTAAKTKAQERQQLLESTAPKAPHPLKNEGEIAKLRKELDPLLEVELAAKGRLLTLKESQAVARKDEILDEISKSEESSRGWFEADEAFQARVKASQSAWESKRKQQAKKKTAAPTKPAGSGGFSSRGASIPNKWVTPSAAVKKAPPKAKPAGGGGVFAAMMMDSDSD